MCPGARADGGSSPARLAGAGSSDRQSSLAKSGVLKRFFFDFRLLPRLLFARALRRAATRSGQTAIASGRSLFYR